MRSSPFTTSCKQLVDVRGQQLSKTHFEAAVALRRRTAGFFGLNVFDDHVAASSIGAAAQLTVGSRTFELTEFWKQRGEVDMLKEAQDSRGWARQSAARPTTTRTIDLDMVVVLLVELRGAIDT